MSQRLKRPHLLLALIAALPLSAFAEAGGKAFNPDLSVNFLGLARDATNAGENRNSASGTYNGLSLQEAEIQFYSNVDPYLKAVALFSVSENNGAYGIDPEEVYLETISLPLVTLRAGKFRLALGKHNQLHTHAFPFIDAPLFQSRILGDDGLDASAVSASALIPLPWFSELTVQAFSEKEPGLYDSTLAGVDTPPPSGKTGMLARYRNLFDVNDDMTAELAFTGSSGQNAYGLQTNTYGSDFTVKWRPAEGGKYHAVIWNTEYLGAWRNGRLDPSGTGLSDAKIGALATYVQYQMAERWWIQARAEYYGLPHDAADAIDTKQSALIGFFPSEFSGFRLQYDHENDRARPQTDHAVTFQYNVTIGAHPAHAY